MIIFTTDEPLTNRKFFLSLIPQLVFLLIMSVILYFYSGEEKRITAYMLYGIIILANVIGLLQLDKLEEIRFDEEKQELHFYSKSYFSKLRKLKTSFAGLTVKQQKDFLKIKKGRRKVFTVDRNDDSFSEEKLNRIIAAFQANNIPVK